MAVTASKEDSQAYAKIGGALDNITNTYTYVAKFVSIADSNRLDPLKNITDRIEKVTKVTGPIQKTISYALKIKDVLDEKKRDGGLLKLGVKISIDLASKLLGVSLTTHPYYAYHKAQLDALADALNADHNSREAVEAYRKAIAAADSKKVAAEFKRLEGKKVDIVASHSAFRDRVGVAADVARGMMTDAFAQKRIAQAGGTGRLLESLTDLEAWRANWAGLSFDAMQLQIMAGDELNVSIEAMNRVKSLVATLMNGSNTNRVAGQAAINNIEWEKYDQVVGQKSSVRLVQDPIRFAQDNVNKAAAWARAIAEMCDFVRTADVLFPSKFNSQLEKLNHVLYG